MQLGRRSDSDFDDFALAAWPRLRWSAYLLCGDHHLAEDHADDGAVVDDHAIESCGGGVDCEVR